MITVRREPGPASAPVEVVERKGLGHPDTLADALAERLSVAYSRHCLQQYGAVLHHNLDKLYLRGGHCRIGLGDFEMTDPVTLTIGGRVSASFAGQPVPYRELFEETARGYLATVLPGFDHARWLQVEHATTSRSRFPSWFHPASLDDLPELAHPSASDTAVVTAWYPETPAERVTLALERHLNREGAGPRYPELGQDIKVMTIRQGQHLDVTVNVAVHPLAASDTDAYDAVLAKVHGELDQLAGTVLAGTTGHRLTLNTGDANPFRGKRCYLLGTGSCLEFGEEGFVGRGNTPAGYIPLHRPKSAEAAFGKNPVYHAGKVYSVHAAQIARRVHEETGAPATVTIASRHSDPLRQPTFVDVACTATPTRTPSRRSPRPPWLPPITCHSRWTAGSCPGRQPRNRSPAAAESGCVPRRVRGGAGLRRGTVLAAVPAAPPRFRRGRTGEAGSSGDRRLSDSRTAEARSLEGCGAVSSLPGPFAALARQVAGQITDVTDCSWQRDTSAVWRLSSASGGCWYLKRHSSGSSGRFHEREVAALRSWAPALVPELAAADPEILVMVVTAVPGEPVLGLQLGAREEQQVHRQAGRLLGRLHESRMAPGADADASRLTSRVGGYLDQAGGLLTPAQRALVRDCASRLAWLGRRVPAVASHGDFQPRNWLWDTASGGLGIIDWERAEPAAAVRDLVRLEYGPWDGRPDLREEFFAGYGRTLSPEEDDTLFCYAVLDALSGLVWGVANGDDEVVSRAWRTFERSPGTPLAHS